MKKIWFVICLVCLSLAMVGCSSRKAAPMKIFSDDKGDEYQTAALKHFSNVSWAKMDFMDAPLELIRENNGSVSTVKIGGIEEDTRYVVVITDDSAVLTRSPFEGKRYSVFVYDNGRGDIKISLHYHVGAPENSVLEDDVMSGDLQIEHGIVIPATEVSDPSKRAEVIFDTLYEKLVDIEGK